MYGKVIRVNQTLSAAPFLVIEGENKELCSLLRIRFCFVRVIRCFPLLQSPYRNHVVFLLRRRTFTFYIEQSDAKYD